MSHSVVLDNDAVLVTRIDDASIVAGGGRPIRHRDAVLVGVRDGGGSVCVGWEDGHGGAARDRLPILYQPSPGHRLPTFRAWLALCTGAAGTSSSGASAKARYTRNKTRTLRLEKYLKCADYIQLP